MTKINLISGFCAKTKCLCLQVFGFQYRNGGIAPYYLSAHINEPQVKETINVSIHSGITPVIVTYVQNTERREDITVVVKHAITGEDLEGGPICGEEACNPIFTGKAAQNCVTKLEELMKYKLPNQGKKLPVIAPEPKGTKPPKKENKPKPAVPSKEELLAAVQVIQKYLASL